MMRLRRAANLLSSGAARMPVGWLRSLSDTTLVVPYYHVVNDAYVPHVSPLYRFRTITEFKADLEFFLRHFAPVSLGDIVDALNETRPLSRPSFHLTFDDGFREMEDLVAPILQEKGVPATFFLNTAFLDGGGLAHHNILSLLLDRLQSPHVPPGAAALARLETLLPAADRDGSALRTRILSIPCSREPLVRSLAETLDVDVDLYIREARPYLSSEQIISLLRGGFAIGAHSHNHPLYADLPLSQQLAQTRTSVEFLEARFGLRPRAFAFPHTDTNVGSAFFSAVFDEGLLDVSFGTGGLVPHFHPRNIERVGMERTAAPASHILARQFARATYFRIRSN